MANIIYVLFVILFLILAVGSFVYTVDKCGFMDAFFLGKGGFYAAYTGMCSK